MERENCWLRQPLSKNFFFSTRFFCIFLLFFRKFLIFLQQTSPSSSKHFFFSSNLRIKVQEQFFLVDFLPYHENQSSYIITFYKLMSFLSVNQHNRQSAVALLCAIINIQTIVESIYYYQSYV